MAVQKDAKGKRPVINDHEKVEETAVSSKISLQELGLSARVVSALHDAKLETAQDILDILAEGEAQFRAIPGIGEKAAIEVRQQLLANGLLEIEDETAEVERERHARTNHAHESTRKTPPEAEKMTTTAAANPKSSLISPRGEGVEQRISFVVRLTVDERGRPRRTEVEHAQSGKKEVFPALDGHRLAAFMKASIEHPAAQESESASAPLPERVEMATPQQQVAPPEGPGIRLRISTVNVSRSGVPGGMTLMLSPDEAFIVEVNFHLEGIEAPSLASQNAAYEIVFMAHEVTSGMSTSLTTYKGNLVEGVLNYKDEMPVYGLPAGLYRLVTLVKLQEPVMMVAHHEGTVFQVMGIRPSVHPDIYPEMPLLK